MQLAGNRSLDGFLAHFRAPSVGCPRCRRHETGPSTTFGRHPPTMASRAKIKPQVDGLRFSGKRGMVEGSGLNVVDRPVSWRGHRRQPTEGARK